MAREIFGRLRGGVGGELLAANVPASERARLDQSDLPKDASRQQALAQISGVQV